MRLMIKRITSVLLVIAMIIPYATVVSGVTTDDVNQAKDNMNSLNQQIADTQAELDKLKSEMSDIESYVKTLDEKMATIDGTIYTVSQQISTKEEEITTAQALLEQAKIDSAEQYESMKLRIKYMYEHNDESYLALLLTAQSMGDMLNKAEYINKISVYDRERLVEYRNTVQLIADTEAQLQTDLEELTTMKDNVEQQKASLALVQTAKVSELDTLSDKKTSTQAYAAQLAADAAQQEKEIKAMEEEIRRQEEEAKKAAANGSTSINNSLPTYDGGIFLWPTPSRRITSAYGDTEDRGGTPHKGVDIGAQTRGVSGDPIYAAYDGVVTIATYSSSAGYWVWINHGNNLYTVYMHNSQLLVSPGQKVTKGQTIALMGTTGNSTGVHLHFGVRLNGVYVNPMSYFG